MSSVGHVTGVFRWESKCHSFQARIQEFSSGGSNLPKKFWQAKKKDKRGGEGGHFSIHSALVWLKSNLAIETVFKTITFHKYDLRSVFSLHVPKHIWRGCLAL